MNRRSFLAALAASSVMVKRVLGMEASSPERITVTNGDGPVGNPTIPLRVYKPGESLVVATAPSYDHVTVDSYGRVVPSSKRMFHTDLYTHEGKVVTESHMMRHLSGCVRKVSTPIGDGENHKIRVVHNLGSRDVAVLIRQDREPFEKITAEVHHLDRYSVRLVFNTPPAKDEYYVTVTGAPDGIYIDDPRYHMVTDEHADSGAAVRRILKLGEDQPKLFAVDVWVNPQDRKEWKRRVDEGIIQFL